MALERSAEQHAAERARSLKAVRKLREVALRNPSAGQVRGV